MIIINTFRCSAGGKDRNPVEVGLGGFSDIGKTHSIDSQPAVLVITGYKLGLVLWTEYIGNLDAVRLAPG